MAERNRREFLSDVGRGMLIAGIGSGAAADLGLQPARAAEGSDRLTFGSREPLVAMLQDTPPDKLLPLLVRQLHDGAELDELVAAAALANARAFGGQHYSGYHTLMAMAPAAKMARELPTDRRPLVVFKVLHRNATWIHEKGPGRPDALHPVTPSSTGPTNPMTVRDAVRKQDMATAERAFAAFANRSPAEAFDQLLPAVEDGHDVHRIVLPYRAWCLIDLVGKENAMALLRQSLRYCVNSENSRSLPWYAAERELLPKLLDQYRLPGRGLGTKAVDDAWVDRMADTIFRSTAAQAADAAAAALAEGILPDTIGEAICLAANQLVLRDAGRTKDESPFKLKGSVHGDSIGVHASDAANAWRNMAKVANPQNTAACLIMGAYMASIDRVERQGSFLEWKPRPWSEHKEAVRVTDPKALLTEAEAAIRANDQAKACAVVARIGELNQPHKPVFDLMLKYAVSEEGALHAEKYYGTVSEEFATTRPALRWRHLIALARVTASEYGTRAAGYDESCRLLGVAT